MIRKDGFQATFYEQGGELFARILNNRGEAMWFDLFKGLTSQSQNDELEAAWQQPQDSQEGEA